MALLSSSLSEVSSAHDAKQRQPRSLIPSDPALTIGCVTGGVAITQWRRRRLSLSRSESQTLRIEVALDQANPGPLGLWWPALQILDLLEQRLLPIVERLVSLTSVSFTTPISGMVLPGGLVWRTRRVRLGARFTAAHPSASGRYAVVPVHDAVRVSLRGACVQRQCRQSSEGQRL